MIPVTRPFLPPRETYDAYLTGIFERNWLTNNGPLVNELEARLREFSGVPNALFLGNGTIAIQLAIKALELNGEIITTPFSYVATTSSIVWENCRPVFADIDQDTLNIDPGKIENLISPQTSAILATHCFGNACEIDHIQEIADRHDLKVIYDAAHCFGTTYRGRSIFQYGDISTTSFHATKLFHTVEGGAVFTKDDDLGERLGYMRNFGHDGPEAFTGVGINGKNSEFHAAMGLSVYNYLEEILKKRKEQYLIYHDNLRGCGLKSIKILDNCGFNYAYFPIIFPDEATLLKAVNQLNRKRIFPRRYFYPSLSDLPYLEKQQTPIADAVSSRVLCLPLYYHLASEEQNFITEVIKKNL